MYDGPTRYRSVAEVRAWSEGYNRACNMLRRSFVLPSRSNAISMEGDAFRADFEQHARVRSRTFRVDPRELVDPIVPRSRWEARRSKATRNWPTQTFVTVLRPGRP